MRTLTKLSLGLIAAFAYSTALVQPVLAHDLELVVQAPPEGKGKPGGGGGGGGGDDGGDGGGSTRTPIYYDWMHSEVGDVFNENMWLGQGVTITVVDDFSSRSKFFGNLGDGRSRSRHGEWTLKQAGMIAPSANMFAHDFYSGNFVGFVEGQFNVLNLSYGMVGPAGQDYTVTDFWDSQEESIISHAESGLAFVSKAAGNDSIDMGATITEGIYAGWVDYLALDLMGAPSVIFVGALDGNGGILATYSNTAGTLPGFQDHFLVVGVESGLTGLAGTSFAAPIISGYAAILASKFVGASPILVASRLLDTARIDTISDYLTNGGAATYGQGEASIFNALAPDCIGGFGPCPSG